MKGLIFTELVRFIEDNYGFLAADDIIMEADLPNGGAFTSVENYPSSHAIRMVELASEKSGTPIPDLLMAFGRFLLDRFRTLFPDILAAYTSVDDLMSHVASHIHEEALIIYPDAQPPGIRASREGGALVISYESHRPLAHIAYGLIERSLVLYDDPRKLEWSVNATGDRATFRLAEAA